MDVKFNDFSLLREHGWKSLVAINAKQYRALNGLLLPSSVFWLLLFGIAIIAVHIFDAFLSVQDVSSNVRDEASVIALIVLGAYPFWKFLQLVLWSFKLIVWRIHHFGLTAKWFILLYFIISAVLAAVSESTTIVMDIFMGAVLTLPYIALFFIDPKGDAVKYALTTYELVSDGEVNPTKFILVMAWIMVVITLLLNLFNYVGEGL